MGEGETAARRFTPTQQQRRMGMLALATGAWVVSFAVLARLGTWAPYAVAVTALVIAALVFGAVPATLLHPSLGTVGVGLFVGVLTVVLTHVAYAVVAPRVPEVRSATFGLLEFLNVGGYSPGARAGLIRRFLRMSKALFRTASD